MKDLVALIAKALVERPQVDRRRLYNLLLRRAHPKQGGASGEVAKCSSIISGCDWTKSICGDLMDFQCYTSQA
jgi:hypothetical protein